MRIHLVTMPWQPIELPSLQVGLLHALLDRTRPDDEVREFHGSLRWAEFLLERSQGAIRPGDHVAVGSESIFDGLGDWVFSGVLYNDPEWGVAQLKEYATRRGTDMSTATAMRVHAAEFIDESASAILDDAPDVVGFTSTFMQNVSSLALAAELKRRRPGLTVVFGGSNCDGPMGHALHRNHRFVDHVVRGEGSTPCPPCSPTSTREPHRPTYPDSAGGTGRSRAPTRSPGAPSRPPTSPRPTTTSGSRPSTPPRSQSTSIRNSWSRGPGAAGGARSTTAPSADSTARR